MKIDDEYVRKHARPGEDWDQARRRVEGEVYERASQLPGCVLCAEQSLSVEEAQSRHELGVCGHGDELPAAAFDPALFNETVAQYQSRHADLASIAQGNFDLLMLNADRQTYAVNKLMILNQAEGYLQACTDLNLFDWEQLQEMRIRVGQAEIAPRKEFIAQVNNPDILPWR